MIQMPRIAQSTASWLASIVLPNFRSVAGREMSLQPVAQLLHTAAPHRLLSDQNERLEVVHVLHHARDVSRFFPDE